MVTDGDGEHTAYGQVPIDGTWIHVAATISGTAGSTNGTGKLFVNGNLVGTKTNMYVPAVMTRNNQYLGKSNWNDPYLNAKMDEFRIWNYVRSQQEIQATMNNTLTGSESGLVAYYKMNDGSGTSLADSSSNSYTATLNNMTDSDWIRGNASFSDSPSSMTFALDPSDNLTVGTTYLTRVTTGVKDASGNSMSSQYDNSNGFTTVSFQPQTKAELQTAVDLWTCSYESTSCNNNLALATYGEINTWDVSLITDMSYLFQEKRTFNDNISLWNVSNVTNMTLIFFRANEFNQDISGWNVSNVTSMNGMFQYANEFNQDISGWDVSNVTNMYKMFIGDLDFNHDISGWDVSNVTTTEYMFMTAHSFNQDISGWDVSNVSNMGSMFYSALSFNQDISGWDVSSVTIMGQMFRGANAFNQDLSDWDVSNVTSFGNMFYAQSTLSDANKCLIHTDFDNNSNWPYDWSGSCE